MLLPNSFDGLRSSQPLRGLTTSLRIVVVVILESPDLVLELLADFHCGTIPSHLGCEGDISDVGEGVVHYS